MAFLALAPSLGTALGSQDEVEAHLEVSEEQDEDQLHREFIRTGRDVKTGCLEPRARSLQGSTCTGQRFAESV